MRPPRAPARADRGPRSVARRTLDWIFRSRSDGSIVVGQAPNLPLFLFIVGLLLASVLPQPVARAFGILAFGSLAWWAFDELFFGVNPFRRVLGAAVLLGLVASAATN